MAASADGRRADDPIMTGTAAGISAPLLAVGSAGGTMKRDGNPGAARLDPDLSSGRNITVAHGPDAVRANVVCPSTIDTESGGAYWDQKAGAKERLLKWYPVGRLGTLADVAYLAVYLASDEPRFMTGAALVLGGGLTAGTRLFGAV